MKENDKKKDIEVTKPPKKRKEFFLKKLINRDNNGKKRFNLKMPTAFTILFLLICFLVVLTWILKAAGVHTSDANNDIAPLGVVDIFYSIYQGFIGSASTIVFIMSLGAFIYILIESKTLEAFAQWITFKLKGKEVIAIIILMIVFSVFGTIEGFNEETLGFYLICIPLILAAGFDVFTAFLTVSLGAGIGVLGSTLNPFAIVLAFKFYGIDELSAGDGLIWRFISWFILTASTIGYVCYYALRVKKNPKNSITFETLEEDKTFFLGEKVEEIKFDVRKIISLITFMLLFIIMIFYMIDWDTLLNTTLLEDHGKWINHYAWFITSKISGWGTSDDSMLVCACFFLIGSIFLGILNGWKEDIIVEKFIKGATDILGVCLIIATAGGISWVLSESHMSLLVVDGMSSSVGKIPGAGRVIVLFIVFIPLSFLIPSTSGFAKVVFTLLGSVVKKGDGTVDHVMASQIVQAFSFANGYINLFSPSSGVVMGSLLLCRLNYGQFIKKTYPYFIALFIGCCALLAIGLELRLP